MRIANVRGRGWLLTGEHFGVDISESSGGEFPSDVGALLRDWDRLRAWMASRIPAALAMEQRHFEPSDLGPVVALPPQVFAIGLNYGRHKQKAGFESASEPVIFTKFTSSLAGARAPLLPSRRQA